MITVSNDPTEKWILTKVIYKDGRSEYGYFRAFDDHAELTLKGNFRFIPAINSLDLRKEYRRTRQLNKAYSVLVDVRSVEDIELLRA